MRGWMGCDRDEPCPACDVVHAPLRICHHEWRCVRRPILDAEVGRGDATSESLWATHRSRCLVVIIGGASPPLADNAFQQMTSRGGGGDRWVAHTGVAGR